MSESNININKGSNRTYININNKVSSHSRARIVQGIAQKLVDKFDAPHCLKFFMKVAWKLTESMIWQHVETAQASKRNKPGDTPLKLFIYLCKVDGV